MRLWPIALVCIVTVLSVATVICYALSLGFDGVILAGGIAAMVGIPAVLITKKVVQRK